MKKYLIVSVLLCSGLAQVARAQPAEIKPIDSSKISTTSVTVKYANVRAAKKFKFQLWDRRAGRSEFRQIDTLFIKRASKQKTNQTSTISGLHTGREYRLRYKPIYIGDREGVWSDYSTFTTKEKALYITLDDNDSLLTDDIPYVYVAASSTTTATTGTYAMTEQADGTWLAEIPDVTQDDTIHYILARNNSEPSSYEQFEPDDISTRRTITVDTVPFEKTLIVDNWRWLDSTADDGTVSSDDYAVIPRDPFVLGVALNDDYPDDIAGISTGSTLTSIADLGLNYVALPYASRMIVDGDTVETTQNVVGYPGDTQYETLLTTTTAAGLTPIMKIDFPVHPDDDTTILNHLNDSTNHSFYSTYLTRWREAMNDGVDFAIAHGIEIVVLDTSFYNTLNLADNDDQYYFNYLLQNDILPVVDSGYSGILTTDELSDDPDFTWYASSAIDWLGATWYPTDVTDLTTVYEPLSTTYNNKPIFFYNLGAYSIVNGSSLGGSISPDDAVVDPDVSDDTYDTDFQEQADTYETALRAIADNDFVVGALAPDYSYAVQHDKLGNIRAKTAALVWQRWNTLFAE